MGGKNASWTALGLATLLLALPPAAPAATVPFKAKLPKAGGISVAQIKVTFKKKPKRVPRLVLPNRRGVPSTVAAVGAVRRVTKSKRAFVARVVLLRRPGTRAIAAQDFGSVNFAIAAPRLTNLGVTGSKAFKISENESPRPVDRVFCMQDAAAGRFPFGFEKTFLDGGMPFLPQFAPGLLGLAGDAICRPDDAAGGR
jgi:hypothetical protein